MVLAAPAAGRFFLGASPPHPPCLTYHFPRKTCWANRRRSPALAVQWAAKGLSYWAEPNPDDAWRYASSGGQVTWTVSDASCCGHAIQQIYATFSFESQGWFTEFERTCLHHDGMEALASSNGLKAFFTSGAALPAQP